MRIKALSETETYIYESEDQTSFTIGRSSEADFTIRINELSRVHCKVYIEDNNQIFIEDLNSKNGVKINGEKIESGKKIQVFPDSYVLITADIQLCLFEGDTLTGLKVEDALKPSRLLGSKKYKRIKHF